MYSLSKPWPTENCLSFSFRRRSSHFEERYEEERSFAERAREDERDGRVSEDPRKAGARAFDCCAEEASDHLTSSVRLSSSQSPP